MQPKSTQNRIESESNRNLDRILIEILNPRKSMIKEEILGDLEIKIYNKSQFLRS